MCDDPFEQFERSRRGVLIPVVVFVLGAALTVVAINALHRLPLPIEVTEPESELRSSPQAVGSDELDRDQKMIPLDQDQATDIEEPAST